MACVRGVTLQETDGHLPQEAIKVNINNDQQNRCYVPLTCDIKTRYICCLPPPNSDPSLIMSKNGQIQLV
jgi:hypothetical protein